MSEDRVLTLVVVVRDKDKASELWESYKDKKLLAGCEIFGISDGNLMSQVDELESDLGEVVDLLNGSVIKPRAEKILEKYG